MPTREVNEEVRKPTDAEIIAEQNERRIVNFTNIDNEAFTHSFRGIKITVAKGETYPCRFPEGDHLAKHLARKILARDKKAKGADKDYKGTTLWTDEEVNALKGEILEEIGMESDTSMSAEDIRKKDIEALKEKYNKDRAKKEAEKDQRPASPPPPTPPKEEVTKAQIIEDLKKRGITANIRDSKDALLKQLMDAEAQGK